MRVVHEAGPRCSVCGRWSAVVIDYEGSSGAWHRLEACDEHAARLIEDVTGHARMVDVFGRWSEHVPAIPGQLALFAGATWG